MTHLPVPSECESPNDLNDLLILIETLRSRIVVTHTLHHAAIITAQHVTLQNAVTSFCDACLISIVVSPSHRHS